MTNTEAINLANRLLQMNADPSDTREGILTWRETRAIAKLINLARGLTTSAPEQPKPRTPNK